MKFLRLLKRELAAEARNWIDEGFVSEEQARRILGRYGARLPDGTERSVGYIVLLSRAPGSGLNPNIDSSRAIQRH